MPVESIGIVALRYVVAVAEAGSFAQAAVRLAVNSSTVSRRVSEVEDRLGVTLMERSRTGVRLTQSGRSVIEQIRRALGELAAVECVARSNGVGSSGEVRLGFRVPPLALDMLRLLGEWRRCHPEIVLKVFEMNDHEIRMALGERRIDAAFVTRYALWPGAVAVPVYREGILAALPMEHELAEYATLTWELLRTETMLTQGWNDSQTARDFYISLLGTAGTFVSHATSKQSILALVAAGYGVTLAVESQSFASAPGIVFRPVVEPDAWVDVDLVWLPESEDAVAGVFVAFMRDRSPLAGL